MIERFHALYVGQIDLDNVGLQGTPADERRYSNERLSEVFFTARDVARLKDQLRLFARDVMPAFKEARIAAD